MISKYFILLNFFLIPAFAFAQEMNNSPSIKLEAKYLSENPEISDIMEFEGITSYTFKFTSEQLKAKSFSVSAKEIWNGKLKTATVIANSATMGMERLKTIKDSLFHIKVMARSTGTGKLKVNFSFPGFSTSSEFDAEQSNAYSLRDITKKANAKIEIGKTFYLLAYILPYEKDGTSYYCGVDASGKPVESWGTEFGIKHYIIFEMKFQ